MNLIGDVICENLLLALPINAFVPINKTTIPNAINITIHILIEPSMSPG
jgi:hypothetical protein